MVNYSIKIVQGFRVSYDNLFKIEEIKKNSCEHQFDRNTIKYCPECGKENKIEKVKCLIDGINYLFEGYEDENEDYIENDLTNKIGLFKAENCYCDQEGDDRDYILGIIGFDKDVEDEEIDYIKQVPKEKVLEKIGKLDIKIPFDENSFGIYKLLLSH